MEKPQLDRAGGMRASDEGDNTRIGSQGFPDREEATLRQVMIEVKMAEINKLSVEKALEKLRADDPPKSKNARLDDKMDVLDEEIKRMRAQRLRLDQHKRKRD